MMIGIQAGVPLQKNSSVFPTSIEGNNHSIKPDSLKTVRNSVSEFSDVKKINHAPNETLAYKPEPDYIVIENISLIKNNNVATESSIDIKSTPNILNEEDNSDSDYTLSDPESIYMDMTGLSKNTIPKNDDYIYEQCDRVENDYEDLDNAERQEVNVLENNKKPKLPLRNLTTEEKQIATAKIKSELAEYITKDFADSGINISKHKLIEGFNKELFVDLFSSKHIDNVKIENLISYYINYGPSSDYNKFKNDEELINKIKNHLFIFSYIFNKEVERDVSGFFTEEFYIKNKLEEYQRLKLYTDVVDTIVDCVLDKEKLVKSLVNISGKQQDNIEKEIIIFNALMGYEQKFVEDRKKIFKKLENIIKDIVKKLNKDNSVNKIILSDQSISHITRDMIITINKKLPLPMEILSNLILDRNEVKKNITYDLLKEIEYIPVELILSKEHRKFANEIINNFIENLNNKNIRKKPNNLVLFENIDKALMLVYFKNIENK